jgi:hypothetical protein
LDRERQNLQEAIARERGGLAQATGNLVRLENQLTALIAYGKSMFHREFARRQNQADKRQVILDQLSDHLRQHLESGDGSNRLAGAAAGSERNGNGASQSRG